MEQYKHKQTGFIAKKEDKENWYNLYHNNNFRYEMPNEFIENTQDWQLIPEVKMEIDEGYSHHLKNGSDNFVCESNKCFQDDQALYYNRAILITNPTPLMKQVIKQIEKGECYERYVDKHTITNKQFSGEKMNTILSHNYPHKLLIIPMEDER